MKPLFKTQDSVPVLKEYDDPIPVYPGMAVTLHGKYFVVQHAILALDKDELSVVVKCASNESE